jgi:hypothetical protein
VRLATSVVEEAGKRNPLYYRLRALRIFVVGGVSAKREVTQDYPPCPRHIFVAVRVSASGPPCVYASLLTSHPAAGHPRRNYLGAPLKLLRKSQGGRLLLGTVVGSSIDSVYLDFTLSIYQELVSYSIKIRSVTETLIN